VHRCKLTTGGPQESEGVVFKWIYTPNPGSQRTCDSYELAEEPTAKIDDVYPLIQQLATARELGVAAPLTIVSGPATMAMYRPDREQLPDTSCGGSFMSAPNARMMTVV
jgi:hypothetical protein